MNGRMYDTDLRRFLSPDNYVQDPTNTQNYNRYQYGYNNPLKYSDPSGEFLNFVFGILGLGAVSYFTGVQLSGGQYNPLKWNIGTFAKVGALALLNVATAGIGSTIYAGVLSATGLAGFVGGFTAGAISGAFVGLMSGAGYALAAGQNIVKGALNGAIGGAISGGLLGGVSEGLRAMKYGGKFWNGIGETHYLEVDATTVNSTNKTEVEYSNKSAREFSDKEFPGYRKKFNIDLHADNSLPNSKYELNNNGMTATLKGRDMKIMAATMRVKGGYKIFTYKSAFISKPTLFLTLQHEYIHVGFFALGLNNVQFHHNAIYNLQRFQVSTWNQSNIYPDLLKKIINYYGVEDSLYNIDKLLPVVSTPRFYKY